MPTSRWFVKRDMGQALKHLARIQDYVVRSGQLYANDYPKEYKAFCLLVVLCEQLADGIKSIQEHI